VEIPFAELKGIVGNQNQNRQNQSSFRLQNAKRVQFNVQIALRCSLEDGVRPLNALFNLGSPGRANKEADAGPYWHGTR